MVADAITIITETIEEQASTHEANFTSKHSVLTQPATDSTSP